MSDALYEQAQINERLNDALGSVQEQLIQAEAYSGELEAERDRREVRMYGTLVTIHERDGTETHEFVPRDDGPHAVVICWDRIEKRNRELFGEGFAGLPYSEQPSAGRREDQR